MKIQTVIVVLLLFCATSHAEAQNGNNQPVTPYFAALFVTNIDSAARWYSGVLQLKVRNRVDNPDRGFKQAVLENERVMIELAEVRSSILPSKAVDHLPPGTRVIGYYKIGFGVPNLDAWHKELESKKIQFFGSTFTDPVSGQRSFLVKDPDGNTVQFFEQQ